MFHVSRSLRYDTRYERPIPSFPPPPFVTGNILLAACRAWRENRSLPPAQFQFLFFLFLFSFTLSPVKILPRHKRITRMARYAESLVRAKAKSDDLSLSPKATSNFYFFFVCLLFTLTRSLFLSLPLARTFSRSFSLSLFLLNRACRPSVF